MYLLGFSLNNLTLMALTIATGFVVDDAIVMIENIARYIEAGRAAAAGRAEGLASRSASPSLADRLADRGADPAAVHGRRGGPAVPRVRRHPGGDDPDFGRGLADPDADDVRQAAASTRRRRSRAGSSAPRSAVSTRIIDVLWPRRCAGCCEHQTATLLVAVGTLVLTVLLYVVVPKGFFPVQDTGVIQGISEAPQSISFAAMAERQQALAAVILKDPAVASLSSFIGVDGTNTTLNSGRMLINLKPLSERAASASEIIRRLQPRARPRWRASALSCSRCRT